MLGYKAFNEDLTCRGFQYEIGQTYSMEEDPIPCYRGFHFCRSIAETYQYYDMSEKTRICKIEALGEVVTDNEVKYCTNKIKILEEITNDWERKGNSNSSNSGYKNSGDRNSGDRNSGDRNLGNSNSGDFNSGDRNSGRSNSGNWNSGNWNSGNENSGNNNSGNNNSGNDNSGNWNSGNWNSGDFNSGDFNSGNENSGYWNSGYGNSGNWNSGYWNSGYWNSGDRNSGVFNTKTPKLMMFDKESDWTFEDWINSSAKSIMDTCPYTYSIFVEKFNMTDEEKESHPEYEITDGYTKTIVATKEDKEEWWNNLSEEDKNIIKALPNFDFDKFRQCVGF